MDVLKCAMVDKHIQECTKVSTHIQEYTKVGTHIQEYTKVGTHIQECTKVSTHIQECTKVYRSMQVLAHLISQRWLCREETHTCCCHGFQFLSLWVKGSKRMREGRRRREEARGKGREEVKVEA